MARQQQKRRRKRYQPGSAYAGDVRPTGFLGFLAGSGMIKAVFLIMALGIAAGGLIGVLQIANQNNSNQNDRDFVIQNDDDKKPTPTPRAQRELRQYPNPPAMAIDQRKTYTATIKTDHGEIKVRLLDDEVPKTVNNFVFLARDGFYDDQVVLFADPDFSVQAGNPTCRRGNGGVSCVDDDGGPGYRLGQERPGQFVSGTVGMINGSQFFIALTDSKEFAGYTPFGKVISGLEVARRLTAGSEIRSIEISET